MNRTVIALLFSCLSSTFGLYGNMIPTPRAPSVLNPPVIVTGKTTGNILYGKLQRAAQLTTSRLDTVPAAAVDDRGKLSSMLWSSFAMASVTSDAWIDVKEVKATRALEGSLLFLDATSGEGGGGFSLPELPKIELPNPFAKKGAATATKPAASPSSASSTPGALDEELLKYAAARKAVHAFVLCDGDEAAVEAAVAACTVAIEELEDPNAPAPKAAGGDDDEEEATEAPPRVGLCTTIIAPANGVSLASTKGWFQNSGIQDHDGELSAPITVENGYLPSGQETRPVGGSGVLAREDFAELVVQCALRLGRTPEEGAPPVRVLRVVPGGSALVERPLSTYDAIIGGPKTRARLGVVASADWPTLLGPFGVVRESSKEDWRELVEV